MTDRIWGKLGRKPVKIDFRTIRFEQGKIFNLAVLPTPPVSFDRDQQLGATFIENIWGNNTLGDCVICERANQELRMQEFQQGVSWATDPITTADVENEYYSEQGCSSCAVMRTLFQGGCDNGLVMLDSMTEWVNKGWTIGNKTYKIDMYAKLPYGSMPTPTLPALDTDLYYRQAISLFGGLAIGVNLPASAMTQFNAGQPWTLSDPPDMNIIGGHAIYIVAYDADSLTCITWGVRQSMSWQWLNLYCDEAYMIIDDIDTFVQNDPYNSIDQAQLVAYLAAIQAEPQS